MWKRRRVLLQGQRRANPAPGSSFPSFPTFPAFNDPLRRPLQAQLPQGRAQRDRHRCAWRLLLPQVRLIQVPYRQARWSQCHATMRPQDQHRRSVLRVDLQPDHRRGFSPCGGCPVWLRRVLQGDSGPRPLHIRRRRASTATSSASSSSASSWAVASSCCGSLQHLQVDGDARR